MKLYFFVGCGGSVLRKNTIDIKSPLHAVPFYIEVMFSNIMKGWKGFYLIWSIGKLRRKMFKASDAILT